MIRGKLSEEIPAALREEPFLRVLEFLKQHERKAYAPGRYDLDADRVYVLVQDNALLPWPEREWESHRRYLDLQCVLCGRDVIGYAPIAALVPAAPYEDDEQIYRDAEGEALSMSAGDFVVFYPEDGHKPNVSPSEAENGRRVLVAVAKIRLDALSAERTRKTTQEN